MLKKKLFSLLTLSIFISVTLAVGDEYLAVAEKMPELKGGAKALYEQIKYPQVALNNKTEGNVYVLVFVNEEGKVDDVKVVKGIGNGCDEAAMDAVKKQSFTPGQANGKPVKVKMAMAIKFKID